MSCSLSLSEAEKKFGAPRFAKFDIEGGEYFVFDQPPEVLRQTTLLIEWHKYKVKHAIPPMTGWKSTDVLPEDALLATRLYEPLP
jgi:hypothetical protein